MHQPKIFRMLNSHGPSDAAVAKMQIRLQAAAANLEKEKGIFFYFLFLADRRLTWAAFPWKTGPNVSKYFFSLFLSLSLSFFSLCNKPRFFLPLCCHVRCLVLQSAFFSLSFPYLGHLLRAGINGPLEIPNIVAVVVRTTSFQFPKSRHEIN